MLTYNGYTVRRTFDEDKQLSSVAIRKQNRLLKIHKIEMMYQWSSCFGLAPILGTNRQQLVIVQNQGGAHCCYHYFIYDLSPMRLLFNSDKFKVADDASPFRLSDLDHDGKMELTMSASTFSYCCGLGYIGSPQPTVIFKYSSVSLTFLPVTHGFESLLLKGADAEVADLDRESKPNWYRLFRVLADYIYAGRETQAWRLYDRESRRFPHAYTYKTEIKRLLHSDATYRVIYDHRRGFHFRVLK